ncbi:hypothetical protein N7G274_006335 [Stereocaulon virgatum]|uniref:Uncharacterized protein n=1 Tax=Stereocaulon virgatum TaxID=373712 RepID=A0ABR4A8Z3_9LECA
MTSKKRLRTVAALKNLAFNSLFALRRFCANRNPETYVYWRTRLPAVKEGEMASRRMTRETRLSRNHGDDSRSFNELVSHTCSRNDIQTRQVYSEIRAPG